MNLRLFRRPAEPVPEAPADELAWPDGVVMRFRTQGGAHVDVHTLRFAARFDHRGAPYAANEPYEIDGFGWRCLGCLSVAREGDTYYERGYRERREARDRANEHAAGCHSVRRPEVA
ncbi:hypothetical protein [Streptomyces sp. NPDC059788]|uniref:hypothetical protein n=1 Tax=Streptomyces sp. NPDC059788 TaxID=3346948 RepID=UPI00365626F4